MQQPMTRMHGLATHDTLTRNWGGSARHYWLCGCLTQAVFFNGSCDPEGFDYGEGIGDLPESG